MITREDVNDQDRELSQASNAVGFITSRKRQILTEVVGKLLQDWPKMCKI